MPLNWSRRIVRIFQIALSNHTGFSGEQKASC
jgi:hypothetical protein